MKKLFSILLLTILLPACSALPNLSQLAATDTPPPVATSTAVPTVTPIPTQNFFATSTSTPITFTPTVTALGADLFTPTNTETPFILPTAAPPQQVGVPGDSLFTPVSVGFTAVLISNNILYWNEGPCMPREVKVAAFVVDPINTYRVVLFTRLREKKNTLNITEWNAGAIMIKADNGSFNYNIRTFNIRRYYYYRDAWLEYQLVALNEDNEIIGRTQIYDRNISLVRCQPVPGP